MTSRIEDARAVHVDRDAAIVRVGADFFEDSMG